ncbi:MAG: hypothetical protein JW940_17830 [Polyangiaceae bacterium]|nr:hypothetical protein [Polyangiaceae bacterium]
MSFSSRSWETPLGGGLVGAAAHRAPPAELFRVLWDLDAEALDVTTDAESIIARVLEHGGLAEIEVLIELYGLVRIHRSLRATAHPIVSARAASGVPFSEQGTRYAAARHHGARATSRPGSTE